MENFTKLESPKLDIVAGGLDFNKLSAEEKALLNSVHDRFMEFIKERPDSDDFDKVSKEYFTLVTELEQKYD